MTHRIAIADDHDVVRQGLRSVLRNELDFHVVAEAADGVSALRMVEQYKPDVLLIDVSMAGTCGLEVIRECGRISPATRAIVVTMHASELYIATAFRNGAAGYVLKDRCSSELPDAVRHVRSGGRYLSPALADLPIDEWLAKLDSETLDPYETLSTRERQVLQLSAEGHTAARVGEILCISARTVETHRATLMRKLGLRTHSDLVLFAVGRGLVAGKAVSEKA